MLATLRQGKRSSGGILGKPRHDLRLRVMGPDGESRALRIASQKCTIGGADSCSLRLRGRGLHPVHCLIVRGSRQTIIRNLSPDNTLNGREFTDACLAPGDQLRVASFDIEVLPHRRRRRTRTPARRATDNAHRRISDQLPATLNLTAAIESRMNRLEEQLIDVQRRQTRKKISRLRRTIDRLDQQLEEERTEFDDERSRWLNERGEFEARLAGIRRPGVDDGALAEDVARLSAELDDVSCQHRSRESAWQVAREQLENQLNQARTRIETLENKLAGYQQQTASFAEERATYESGTSDLASSVEQLTARLAEEQAARSAQGQAWESTRQELEQQLKLTRTKLDKATNRLQQVERQLSEERAASTAGRERHQQEQSLLRQERAAYESQIASTREALRESEAQVKHWEVECTTLASRAEELEQHVTELKQSMLDSAAIDESAREATSLQMELVELRRSHDLQANEWDTERQRLESELDAIAREREQQRDRVEELEYESTSRTNVWEQERSELKAALQDASESLENVAGDRRLAELEEQLEEVRGELEYWRSQSSASGLPSNMQGTVEIEAGAPSIADLMRPTAVKDSLSGELERGNEPHSDDAPANTAEILASFGYTDEEAAGASDRPEERQPNGGSNSESQTEDGPAPTAALPQTETRTAPPKHDDDAIEDYMNRLLARVRGEQGVAPVGMEPTEERRPITEVNWSPSKAEEAEAFEPAKEFTEYTPRRSAPEGTDSLAAMRSLANDSARSAIASHARRNWMEAAKYEICGASFGVTAGAVAFVTLEDTPMMALLGVVAGFVMTFIFSARALAVRSQLMAHSEAQSLPDNEEEIDADTADMDD